jgi:HAD superfamily hydrolase (TIGR01548 family)
MSLLARDGVLEAMARPGLLVLDVDGVLLDPRPSFYAAAMETALRAASHALGRDSLPGLTLEDVEAFKQAGGWNDDFDLAAGLAYALVIRELRSMPVAGTARRAAGGLPSLMDTVVEHVSPVLREKLLVHVIRERCAARYAGRARCREMYGLDPRFYIDLPEDGLWRQEPVLVDALKLRATGFELAFFTGRNPAEAAIAAERLNLDVPVERRVVDDGKVPKKPSPEGLLRLARHAGGRAMVFVGDSVDDQAAALAYRERAATEPLPPLFFVRIVTGVFRMDAAREILLKGADVVAAGLDAYLRALPSRDRRDDA